MEKNQEGMSGNNTNTNVSGKKLWWITLIQEIGKRKKHKNKNWHKCQSEKYKKDKF